MAGNVNQLRRNPKTVTAQEKAKAIELLKKINARETFKLCGHSVERCNQRQINEEQILDVLRNAKYENVVELGLKDHKGRPLPRMVLTSNKIYGQGRGRYRVAVVVNCYTLEVITTYRAFLANNYKEIVNDNFNFCDYFRR